VRTCFANWTCLHRGSRWLCRFPGVTERGKMPMPAKVERHHMSKKKKKTHTVLDTLRLFKENADELRASSYLKQLPSQEWAIHFDNTTGENSIGIVDIRPDDDSRKALLLTLRFFENELNLKHVIALYDDLPVSEEQKRCVRKSFETFQKQLASGLVFVLNVNHETYMGQRIFDAFMYGHYVHSEEPLREQLKLFAKSQTSSMMANQEFDATINLYLQYIFWLYNKNDIAIKALEALHG